MSAMYRAGDVVRPRSAHDPALRDVIADVLAVAVQPDARGRGFEVVTVRLRGSDAVAVLGVDELDPAPLHHWTTP